LFAILVLVGFAATIPASAALAEELPPPGTVITVHVFPDSSGVLQSFVTYQDASAAFVSTNLVTVDVTQDARSTTISWQSQDAAVVRLYDENFDYYKVLTSTNKELIRTIKRQTSITVREPNQLLFFQVQFVVTSSVG